MGAEEHPIMGWSRDSSVVEQRFRKARVGGSSPSPGSTFSGGCSPSALCLPRLEGRPQAQPRTRVCIDINWGGTGKEV